MSVLEVQVNSQLQMWISPLKVRVASVALWEDEVVGERLVHHTIRSKVVLEANQWQQQVASQWLSVGSLLWWFWQNKASIFTGENGMPEHVDVFLPKWSIADDLSGFNQTVAGVVSQSEVGGSYMRRCVNIKTAFEAEERPVSFTFTKAQPTTMELVERATNLLLDKSAMPDELMPFAGIGPRIRSVHRRREAAKNAKFFGSIARRRPRKISKRSK